MLLPVKFMLFLLYFYKMIVKIVNMSPRAMRNRVFDAITPQALKKHLPEHGRLLANAASYSRELMAPALFTTAAKGMKGAGPALLRVGKELLDGYDGYMAEKAKDFKTAKPTIPNLAAFRKAIYLQGRPIKEALKDTVGAVLDRETDQVAQIADQIGNLRNGDLSPGYVMINVARNYNLKRIRQFYKGFLPEGQEPKSRPSGQAKTVIMGAHQILESAGTLDKHPTVRRVLSGLGIAATVGSFVDTVASMEKEHLSTEYDTESLGMVDGFALGIARYATRNMPNVEITPTNLSLLPDIDVAQFPSPGGESLEAAA